MAGTRIIVDDRSAMRRIGKLLKEMGNLEPVFADFGEYMVNEIQERFDDESGPDGTGWDDLKPATWRRKKIPKVLTETSRLRDSIAYKAERRRVRIGTNVVYAAIHQLGGTAGRGAKIPARPFLGVNSRDLTELEDIMKDYLE